MLSFIRLAFSLLARRRDLPLSDSYSFVASPLHHSHGINSRLSSTCALRDPAHTPYLYTEISLRRRVRPLHPRRRSPRRLLPLRRHRRHSTPTRSITQCVPHAPLSLFALPANPPRAQRTSIAGSPSSPTRRKRQPTMPLIICIGIFCLGRWDDRSSVMGRNRQRGASWAGVTGLVSCCWLW